MPDCLLCDLGFKPVNIVTMPVLYDGRIRYLHLKESNPLYKHLKMMKDFNPSTAAKNRYLFDARRAMLYSSEAYTTGIRLRMYYVDPAVDTNVCGDRVLRCRGCMGRILSRS